MDAMTIVVTPVSRANRAGNCFFGTKSLAGRPRDFWPTINNKLIGRRSMPRGRSTFTKRQKEQTRQQRQRDKAERRNQRKQEKPEAGSVDNVDDLRENAEAQAALFHMGPDQPDSSELSAKKPIE